MISYTHIGELSGISAYKSCFCAFRLKESKLTWLWSYILRHCVVREQYSLFSLFNTLKDCVAVRGEKSGIKYY
ncbi:hypothetical protein YC2023_117487 [Brassica napus]